MTGVILTNAERDQAAALLAQAETYAQAKARRRAERIAEKIAARSRISELVAVTAATPKTST